MIPSPLLAVRQFGLLQLEVEVLVVLHRFQVVAVPEGVSASSGKAQGAGEVNDKSLSEHSSNGSDSLFLRSFSFPSVAVPDDEHTGPKRKTHREDFRRP